MNYFNATFYYLIFALNALAFTGIGLYFAIPWLKSKQFGQHVRTDGPQTHLQKEGTPTSGGIFFLLPVVFLSIVGFALGLFGKEMLPILLFVVAVAGVGLIDDLQKIKVSSAGISAKQKVALLGSIILVFAMHYLWFSSTEPFIYLPWSKTPVIVLGIWKVLYWIFILFYAFFCINAVNITDGLDGLCGGITVIVLTAITALLLIGKALWPLAIGFSYTNVILIGGIIGYLIYNRFPARIMMGDTGALGLGAYIGGLLLVMGVPWLFLLIGFIYVIEGLSTILQVVYFRKTGGKRLFKMAPLHHHFELSGIKETELVPRFWVATVGCCLVGIGAMLYLLI